MIEPYLIKKQRIILIIFLLLIICTVIAGMGIGDSPISYGDIISTITGYGTLKNEFVLFYVRLPRIAVTILAGMSLALSGSILQGITKNDLADPGIIGINSGAGVAITVLFLFFPVTEVSFVYFLPFVAFVGAIIVSIFIYLLSYNRTYGFQPIKLVLLGVGVSMALSGLMVILISSTESVKVDFISKWLSGNIWGTDWPFVLALLPWLLVLIPFVLYKANRLNIIRLSKEVAIGVGVSVEKERIQLLLAAVALSASAVSVTGGISFIGLISPHMAKALVGPRNQLFIPVAILIGGWFLLIADTIGQHMVSGGIPAGIMVALIGAPYFVYLLLKK